MDPDTLARVLDGDEAAWTAFIEHFERRLAGYFRPRVPRDAIDDLVQETFVAFWRSIPNFEAGRPAEPLLFAIAANKLTDRLRREGRRPVLPLSVGSESTAGVSEPAAAGRAVSSLARSRERRVDEEHIVSAAMGELIARWRGDGAWERVAVLELTLVGGWTNVDTAGRLRMSEQTVANHKSYGLRKIREEVARRGVAGKVLADDPD